MTEAVHVWADPRLVYFVATAAVLLLLITIVLFRRRKRSGRQAAIICLLVSIAFHLALIFLVPLIPESGGGRTTSDAVDDEVGVDSVAFSSFDPSMQFEEVAGENADARVAPLPVSELAELLEDVAQSPPEDPATTDENDASDRATTVPDALAIAPSLPTETATDVTEDITSMLSDWLESTTADATADLSAQTPSPATDSDMAFAASAGDTKPPIDEMPSNAAQATAPSTDAAPAAVAGGPDADFANRVGSAKQRALMETGGSEATEQAVARALQYLVAGQRSDGAWDPAASGAGVERSPLGMSRGNAGSRSETALTGLAVLSLVGAGNTHQHGEYAENVYKGLAYLIRAQKPDGSLAGNASVYEATYCHGMAALAMCEAAAITRDASAIESARRAVAYTQRLQHPTTGGWRYTAGDPGDLSQLGWQAMVLDGGHRAGLTIDPRSVQGINRFLDSVKAGSHGGLATYRPGEAPSRTMTAEALATRLLIGGQIQPNAIQEAERSLLQQPPGTGQDNYYYWYYATLALHQLQDDAWKTWNEALKQRLLSSQKPDGSWPTTSVWGGYGGSVYTTSMATLCLESYYRHAVRNDDRFTPPERVAERP